MNFYDQIAWNRRKTYLLVFFFLVFITFIGYVLGMIYGNSYFGIGLALIIGTLYFVFSYYNGANVILALSKAQEAKKPEHAYLINTVEGLSIAAGLPVPKIYVINDPALNAFATGRDPDHAAVAVTKGLLEKMNREELEGVLAHEMAHIQNRDILVMMLASVMVGITVLLSDFILRSFLFGRNRNNNNSTAIFILIGFILAILSPLVGEAIKLAISRKREYLADASGAKLTRNPHGLASALKKIKHDSHHLNTATKATAHLYISTPFKGKMMMSKLFSTHPPLDERIKILEEM